ncbi:hypothetical protein Poli38472_007642 [Pythium oligandrum]|uniref:DNA repair protein REV1 n=1 Tax=Pythium oligandrum TaxID=41045 RepID=A0A8K1CSL4_PYTOL|nr:hypothetical protein Poli38472_007642 [Pythium oligandrum]|eukprot:TMW67970.1 hypothetical protein Poli38472_007642 [Pythium oligandrum]
MSRHVDGGGEKPGIKAFGNGLVRQEDAGKKRKELGEHHGGSFGVYMSHKIQKLRNQNQGFVDGSHRTESILTQAEPTSSSSHPSTVSNSNSEEVTSSSASSTLFTGVHVLVDGYTVPSKEEIRTLVLMYGGGFEHYDTSQVTHIVATHIAVSRLKQLKKMRRPPPVVHPDWILKSIEQNTLLPVQPFLYHGFGDPTQNSVISSLSLSASAKSQSVSPGKPRSEEITTFDRPITSKPGEQDENSFSESDGGSEGEDHDAMLTHMLSQPAQSSPEKRNPGLDPPPLTNSSRDGPAFVRHFFAKSRLHHIGSWRSTFQQRAGEFLSKYKGKPFLRESPASSDRVILHVDMDCFFVAVAIRDKPEYQNVPIAIAHSGNAGSSEISSCNYLARERGVKASMFMQSAKDLCPELVVLPYKFDEIEEVSFQIYDIFFSRTPYVQAMSCDEAYLEFAKGTDGVSMAKEIRQAIFEKTRCTASVGISYNILLAKLATREGKPNGLFHIASPEQAEPFLLSLKIRDLPGVGRRMGATMDELGLQDILQLRSLSKFELQKHFGKTTSEMLHNYARGIDIRPLSIESNMMRKSVSAVVNFGIRFQSWKDATEFMMALAEEMSSRLKNLKVRTKCLTLQIMKRREGAPVVPSKFMGHGICDNFSKSRVLPEATDSELVIGNVCIELLRQFNFPNEDLRGVGIQSTKLVSTIKPTETRTGQLFRTWLSEKDGKTSSEATNGRANKDMAVPRNERSESESHIPTLSQINPSVLEELPPAIRDEIMASYASSSTRGQQPRPQAQPQPPRELSGWQPPRAKGKQKLVVNRAAHNSAQRPRNHAVSAGPVSALNDISFSQVDQDVYHALPMTIRKEINSYAKRRKGTSTSKVPYNAPETQSTAQQATASYDSNQLQTIEELFDCLVASLEYQGLPEEVDTASRMAATSSAFDAIYLRILVEIENHALDEALRMTRYLRRKCQNLIGQRSSEALRIGFNIVLEQVNSGLQMNYQGVFSSRLVAPL